MSQSQVSSFCRSSVASIPTVKTVAALHGALARVANGEATARAAAAKERTVYKGNGHDTRVILASFIETATDPDAFEPGTEVTVLLNKYRTSANLKELSTKDVKKLNTKLKRERRRGEIGVAWGAVKKQKASIESKENRTPDAPGSQS